MRSGVLGEILRFGGVGLVATAVHVGIYLAALPHVLPQIANAVGFVCALSVSYLGHTWFSFVEASGRVGRGRALALRFVAVTAIGYVVNAGWVALTTQVLGLPSGWAAVLIAGATPALTFFLFKFWVYAPR